MHHVVERSSVAQEPQTIFQDRVNKYQEKHPMNILSTEIMVIGVEMTEMQGYEHIALFWQFVPSLSPRITGLPVRRHPNLRAHGHHELCPKSHESCLKLIGTTYFVPSLLINT
jgi:hypothetical protein